MSVIFYLCFHCTSTFFKHEVSLSFIQRWILACASVMLKEVIATVRYILDYNLN